MISFCICDDNESKLTISQNLIKAYCVKHQIAHTIDCYSDSSQLADKLTQGIQYHIYLLDVLMPLMTGMDLAAIIRQTDSHAHIIFLTSSDEYAIESYEYHAEHYLLKPIDHDKLYQILDRLHSDLISKQCNNLIVQKKGINYSIPFTSICYFESFRNKILIHKNTGDEVSVYITLSELEQKLQAQPEFVRIQRSYLINMNFITQTTTELITLLSGDKLPLSTKYREAFQKSYIAFTQNQVWL